MTNSHLTDETLQAFLLKEMQDDTAAMHLSVCAHCQTKLEKYQYLLSDIQKIEPEIFPFDVTAVVMDKILCYEKQKSRKQERALWVLFIFLAILISSLSIPFIPPFLTAFYAMPIFTTLLIVGTALLVFLFLLADLYKRYQLKEQKIVGNNLQPTP
ncbi:MAG: hypothetical protein ACO1N0_20300 [Fluviicola sp.]